MKDIVDSSDIRDDLKPDVLDGTLAVARAGLGALPIVGGTVTELLNVVLNQPLSRRRDEWLIRLYDWLSELRSRFEGFDPKELANNDQFVTVTLHATQVAMRTHQEEKLLALQNAVLNSAIKIDISDDIQQMFISYIDSLTPSHLCILAFANNPRAWMEKQGIEVPRPLGRDYSVCQQALFNSQKDPALHKQLCQDLTSRGLCNGDPLNILDNMMSPEKLECSIATDLGNEFMRFITSPLPE